MQILIVSIIVIALIIVLLYNSLIYKKNQVKNSFSCINVFLKKRYDLIPNLVAVVKGYVDYERSVLKQIVELRQMGINESVSEGEKIEITQSMTKNLHSLWGIIENYPDLKANKQFLKLQEAFNDIEEQIAAARRSYNASVNDYNNAVQMFPISIIASIFGMKMERLFEVDEAQKEAPRI